MDSHVSLYGTHGLWDHLCFLCEAAMHNFAFSLPAWSLMGLELGIKPTQAALFFWDSAKGSKSGSSSRVAITHYLLPLLLSLFPDTDPI